MHKNLAEQSKAYVGLEKVCTGTLGPLLSSRCIIITFELSEIRDVNEALQV